MRKLTAFRIFHIEKSVRGNLFGRIFTVTYIILIHLRFNYMVADSVENKLCYVLKIMFFHNVRPVCFHRFN